MKGVLTILTLLVFSFTTKAYENYGLWCNGQITLENGEVIEGEINYDLKFEVIQIRDNGIVRAFTAEGVAYFTMFDPINYRQRDYISLEHQVNFGYKRKTFFEIVAEGNITILRRSKYIRRPRITEDYRAPHIYLNAVCKHSYYAIRKKEWVEINDFEAQVLPWMSDFEQEIDNYIEAGKLKLKYIHAQMRVIHLYNQLYDNKFKAQQANLYYGARAN